MNEQEIYKLYSRILSRVSFSEFIIMINNVYNSGYEKGYDNGANEMLGSGRDSDMKNK